MTRPAGSPGLLSRTPLRIKLVAASLVLVVGALIMIGLANTVALKSYLISRVDVDLHAAIQYYDDDPVLVPTGRENTMPSGDFIVGAWVGRLIAVASPVKYADSQLPSMRRLVTEEYGGPETVPSVDGRMRWRIIYTELRSGVPIAVAEDLSKVDNAVQRLVLINILVGTGVLVAIAMVGVWLVRVSLRPLVEMEGTAAAIAGGDLTRRIPELDPRTEAGQLARALNAMLAQIEGAFRARAASELHARRSEERMRQFVADASHELRTPLTTIRGFAELYRQGATTDIDGVLLRVEAEAARMGLLVEDLLLLARLDQERPLELAPVELATLVRDAGAAVHAIAPDRSVDVQIQDPADELVVSGDEARLRQVIGNLITNALAHTAAGTAICLHLRRDGDEAVIEVADSGPGLTGEQAARVFERFYRVDKARTRGAARPAGGGPDPGRPGVTPHSGTGLGLAIVAALVAAHDGTVEVDSQPGLGATFRVRLPIAPAPADPLTGPDDPTA